MRGFFYGSKGGNYSCIENTDSMISELLYFHGLSSHYNVKKCRPRIRFIESALPTFSFETEIYYPLFFIFSKLNHPDNRESAYIVAITTHYFRKRHTFDTDS